MLTATATSTLVPLEATAIIAHLFTSNCLVSLSLFLSSLSSSPSLVCEGGLTESFPTPAQRTPFESPLVKVAKTASDWSFPVRVVQLRRKVKSLALSNKLQMIRTSNPTKSVLEIVFFSTLLLR